MPHGLFWRCPGCGGSALGLDLLRRTFRGEQLNDVWQRVVHEEGVLAAPCPGCGNAMREIIAAGPPLEVCRVCHFFWFDAGELQRLSPLPAPAPAPEMPPAARQALAIAKVQMMAEAERDDLRGEAPDELWKRLVGYFGLPVEIDDDGLDSVPWLTWSLAALVVVVSLLAMQDLERAVAQWGLVPAAWDRSGGLTLLTSFFLHGGILHLVGNLYFLIIFGDNVECRLGRWRYLLLVAGASLVGDAAHIALDPHSMVPCMGASGGISGIIVYYALKFPKARLAFNFRLFWWFRLPAWFALLLWVLLQGIGIWQQLGGFSRVSAAAHLGGAAAGLLAWVLWRRRGPLPG